MQKRKNETWHENYLRTKPYRQKHKAKFAEYQRRYRQRLREMGVWDIISCEANRKRRERAETDSEYAEHIRDITRQRRAEKRRLDGKAKRPYKPCLSRRYPSWACQNGVDIRRGTFLPNAYSKLQLKNNLSVVYDKNGHIE